MEEKKQNIALKETNGMFLSVCIEMEMIHFTVINFLKISNHKRTIFMFFIFYFLFFIII